MFSELGYYTCDGKIFETKLQAQADAKQSALNKLMALGLTEEEALALGVK